MIKFGYFSGSKSDLWHFGFYKPDDSGKEKVYESKPGGVPSYSDEMQIAVHDQFRVLKLYFFFQHVRVPGYQRKLQILVTGGNQW